MTRSNRFLNRLILIIVALALLVAAAYLLAPQLHTWMPAISLPRLPDPTPTGLWIVAVGCVGAIILAIVWIVTRGRGRTPRMITLTDKDGGLAIDAHVVSDLVGEALSANPDVVTAGASAFMVRGSRMLSIRLEARRGSDLPALIRSTEKIVSDLDEVIQQRIPVLLQVASGLRANVAHETRTR